MKNLFRAVLALLLFALFSNYAIAENSKNIDEFILQMQSSLDQKDIQAYLNFYSPAQREREQSVISSFFDDFEMDSVNLYKVLVQEADEEDLRVYIRAFFQNSYSVLLDMWDLKLRRMNGQLQIVDKNILGNTRNLYKIVIPSDRIERVKRFEISHEDIALTFDNALLFYDNIPGLETALLVIGKGNVRFSPSLSRERHQLNLFYKKNVLEDRLNYGFFRFSNSFFQSHVRIIRGEEPEESVTQSEMNRAYSLFMNHYFRSFTIKNSLNEEWLSFLPQGEEVVFEFEGEKIGRHTYIYSPFAEEEVSLYRWNGDKIINLYSPSVEEGKKKLYISFRKMFDVKTYDIDIDFNPQESYLSGKARIAITPLVESLDSVKLKLNPDLEILRINDEDNHNLFFTRDQLRKLLYVYFLHSPERNKTTSIEVFYRGTIRPPSMTSDVVDGPQIDDRMLLSPLKSETLLFTQSAFWYPAPADDDYFQAQLNIIVPPEYTCIASGELIGISKQRGLESVADVEKMGWSKYIYRTKSPLKYLAFVVGYFLKIQEDSLPIPIRYFRTSDIHMQRWDLFGEAKKILQFYESRFGPFPFEKLSVVQRLWLQRGGHSPASFIILNELPRLSGQRRLISPDTPVDLSRWKEYFLAHEIAHQWWGQAVTWATYHDQWISEGLAQFSAILYLKDKYGDREFSHILKQFSRWTEKKSDKGAITMGSRISYVDFEAYQSIIYNKTALVLNMLNDIIGEEKLFQGLKGFFQSHKYGAARTYDFIQAFQTVAERDLTNFFKNWFDSYELPEVLISQSIEKIETGYMLHFKVVQMKGPFVFPLWVEWEEQQKKVRNMLIVEKKIHDFSFHLETKPKKISVNPDKAVPGKFH